MAEQYFEGIGRRKSSTARVRLMSGSGAYIINDKTFQEYFTRTGDVDVILEPLKTVGQSGVVDISCLVNGGGVTGQRDAVQLGIARALLKMNPDLKPMLRKGGYLTRDPREKERKKPGLKRARKAPTYTKR
jgi:small subunit ribosomal protein S9